MKKNGETSMTFNIDIFKYNTMLKRNRSTLTSCVIQINFNLENTKGALTLEVI